MKTFDEFDRVYREAVRYVLLHYSRECQERHKTAVDRGCTVLADHLREEADVYLAALAKVEEEDDGR